jgi:metal-responsive CopG/Arc/MetJ family transcriptional regulator
MTGLNDDDLQNIDALVEEVFKSRSEAVAFFIREGIQCEKTFFKKSCQQWIKLEN